MFMYNRGLINLAGIYSPLQRDMDDQVNWLWFSPHPVAPYMYLLTATMGPDFAITILAEYDASD